MKSKCEDCGNNGVAFPEVQCSQEPFGEEIAPIKQCKKFISISAALQFMAALDAQPYFLMGLSYPGYDFAWARCKPLALHAARLRHPKTNEMPFKITIQASIHAECIQDWFKNICPVVIV